MQLNLTRTLAECQTQTQRLDLAREIERVIAARDADIGRRWRGRPSAFARLNAVRRKLRRGAAHA